MTTTSKPRTERDGIIGRQFPVFAPHAGHTVTVIGRDREYRGAYLLECSCGQAGTMIGTAHIDKVLDESTVSHGSLEHLVWPREPS